MKRIVASLCFLALTSCNKEYETYGVGYWKNLSNHIIKIQGYKNGIITSGEVVNLGPGEEIKAGSSETRGRNKPGFWREYFTYSDSIVVTFDNQYKVIHNIVSPTSQSTKSYPFSSTRNLANIESYKCESSEKKRLYTNVYTYEFNESDYQYAL